MYTIILSTNVRALPVFSFNHQRCLRSTSRRERYQHRQTYTWTYVAAIPEIDPRFEEDVMKVSRNYEENVERKSLIGETAKARVLEQIDQCVAFAQKLNEA